MAGSGSESFTGTSIDPEVIPHSPEEDMAVRLELCHAREEARVQLRSDSIRRESIMSTKMAHGPSSRPAVAASPEAVHSVWCLNALADAQPLRWRYDIKDAPSSDEAIARHARRASH